MSVELIIVPTSALVAFGEKVHNFTSDAFKLALFNSSASFSAASTVYGTTNECSGTGYTAAGFALTNVAVSAPAATKSAAGWVDLTTGNLTVSDIRWLMVHNTSASNKIVMLLKLNTAISKSGAPLTVRFPQPAAGVGPLMWVVGNV